LSCFTSSLSLSLSLSDLDARTKKTPNQRNSLRRLRAARQKLSAQTDASEEARKVAAPALATAARCLSAAAADLAEVFRRAGALRKRLEEAASGSSSSSPPPPPPPAAAAAAPRS
jgi:hypothetical protein